MKYMMLVCVDPSIAADGEEDKPGGYDIDTLGQ